MNEPFWKSVLKYLLHGTLFLILYIGMIFLWVFFLVALVSIGSFIGIILGFIALFFIVGGLNTFLADIIWSIPMKTGWKSLLTHGIVLFTLLLVANVPHIIINAIAQDPSIMILLLVIYAFVDGFVAKNVAVWWKKEVKGQEMVGRTPASFMKKCVKCGQDIPLASETCPFCGSEQK